MAIKFYVPGSMIPGTPGVVRSQMGFLSDEDDATEVSRLFSRLGSFVSEGLNLYQFAR